MAINYDKYIYSKTSVIANSGSDERGKISGGKPGDQNQKEFCLRSWYSRPWSHIFRHSDPRVRRLIAELAIEAALNDNIGYNQANRTSFWSQLKVSGYRPANITKKCDADCSAGANSIVKAVGYLLNIEKLKNVSSTNTSRNTKAGLKAAGFQVLTDSKYRTSAKYLLPGDVLLYENHHVAINVARGSKAVGEVASSVDTTKPSTGSTTPTIPSGATKIKITGDSVNIRVGAGTNYEPIKIAHKGDVYQAADTNGWKCIVCDNQMLWISGKYVDASNKCTGDLVNIRIGPSTEFESIGTVSKGAKLTMANTTGWIPILVSNAVCWVSEKYAAKA